MNSENNGPFNNGRGSNGQFLPGNPGKPKGAEIKATSKIKEFIFDFLTTNLESIQESYDKLKPIEKLQFVTAILPYAIPKLSNVQGQTKVDGGLTITWTEPGVPHTNGQGSNGELQRIQEGIPDNLQPGGDQVGEDLHP